MYPCNCNNRVNCAFLAIAASVIIGIVAGILTFTGVIAIGTTFLWVTFGVALLYLAALLFSVINNNTSAVRSCVCANSGILTLSILGTLLASVILLGVAFAATSVLGAIVAGALLASFALLVGSAICLIRCIANCGEC